MVKATRLMLFKKTNSGPQVSTFVWLSVNLPLCNFLVRSTHLIFQLTLLKCQPNNLGSLGTTGIDKPLLLSSPTNGQNIRADFLSSFYISIQNVLRPVAEDNWFVVQLNYKSVVFIIYFKNSTQITGGQ